MIRLKRPAGLVLAGSMLCVAAALATSALNAARLTPLPPVLNPAAVSGSHAPHPVHNTAGEIVGAYTDARKGLPALPPTAGEQEKLALARQAVEMAEAAGTRAIEPEEKPEVVFGAEAAETKMQRLRTMEPRSLRERPGVPAEKGGER